MGTIIVRERIDGIGLCADCVGVIGTGSVGDAIEDVDPGASERHAEKMRQQWPDAPDGSWWELHYMTDREAWFSGFNFSRWCDGCGSDQAGDRWDGVALRLKG